MSVPLLTLQMDGEADLVMVRQRTRVLSELLQFEIQDQTRIATAVSEIARNAIQYAGHGRVQFTLEGRTAPQLLTITVSDRGSGIRNLDQVLAGECRSTSGLGMGIVGARRLVDHFSIESRPGQGTRVVLRKVLPRHAPMIAAAEIPLLAERLNAARPEGPIAELQRQNRELLQALDALRIRQEELVRLNQELDDTNRGVVALFAELDEKADHLRRADEMKSRFLSNMSHEFRTPLNAVRGLANLLLQRMDGELTAEQEHQVTLIDKAASDLSELVDDLLDLAKVEAGKAVVRPVEFEVRNLFGALRGMLRPMLVGSTTLVFEDPVDVPVLFTDEGKVSQVLRNFISNAIKFTEAGEVRVKATMIPDTGHLRLSVADTGIGIAPEDQARVFQEFVQLDTPLQHRSRGTGLGLPLSRKLADLLGGRILLQSAPGQGSTFSLDIPPRYQEPKAETHEQPGPRPLPGLLPVLVVEDSPEIVLLYRRLLQDLPYEVLHASSVAGARRALRRRPVRAIILDIALEGEDSWSFLAEMKADPATAAVPVIVITEVDDRQKAVALGANEFFAGRPNRRWLTDALHRNLAQAAGRLALVIDDEEPSRYLVARLLRELGWEVLEADGGGPGLQRARAEKPDAVLLDLRMPDLDGFEVLARLKGGEATSGIPVIVVTSKVLSADEEQRIRGIADGLLPKSLPREQALDLLGRLLLSTLAPPAGVARRVGLTGSES